MGNVFAHFATLTRHQSIPRTSAGASLRFIIFRRFRQLQLPSGQHSTILRSYAQAAIELFMPRQQSRTTMRLSPSICAERANNSFKPNLLRYGKGMAEKACHTFASTTQVGLTQALDVWIKQSGNL